jgi:pimeloyl-ACP methyl ester carboxylesterase
MEKLFIENRLGKKISVLIEKPDEPIGLAFIMHGLGSNKDRNYIKRWADIFLSHGFISLRFDTTNTYGESEGKYEDATITSYYQDLEDVINWAKTQDFYIEPFILMGHSFGGICTAMYAEHYPEEIKALAPISTVVSGKLSLETYDPNILESWKETGWNECPSSMIPGLIKKLPWSHMEDRQQYDLLSDVGKLTMPVLMLVGSKDDLFPVEQQQILFDALPGPKELHVILGAPHSFREEEHIAETERILDTWLTKLEK